MLAAAWPKLIKLSTSRVKAEKSVLNSPPRASALLLPWPALKELKANGFLHLPSFPCVILTLCLFFFVTGPDSVRLNALLFLTHHMQTLIKAVST